MEYPTCLPIQSSPIPTGPVMWSIPPTSTAMADQTIIEEEEQPQPRRRTKITSGKLRTMDTTAVKQVLWPHELVFTPDGQPAVYDSMSCMAFVNAYLAIMAHQKDTLRNKMAIHLQEMIEDGETFGCQWSVPITRPGFNTWSKAGPSRKRKSPSSNSGQPWSGTE